MSDQELAAPVERRVIFETFPNFATFCNQANVVLLILSCSL